MLPWLFSSTGRPWKILGALLLLYAGCRWSLHGRHEPEPWACEGHPERWDGREFWIFAERITAADPETGTLEVEPHQYRLRIQVPEGTWPAGAAVDRRLYARLSFRKDQGFLLAPGARTTPPQPWTHYHLYLVSLPALAVATALFLKRFRPGPGGFRPREDADA